jgi:HK97 family phage major capsid protein
MVIPTDRKSLLALLRDQCGYEGKEDLDAVKAFISDEDNPIELVDEDDQPINVEDLWAKAGSKPPRKIVVNPEAGETEDERESRLRGDAHRRPTGGGNYKAARMDARMHLAERTGGLRIGDEASSAKRAYDQRIKAAGNLPPGRQPVYKSADMAEFAGAWLRATNMLVNGKVYSRLDEDIAICQKAGSSYDPTLGSALVPPEIREEVFYLTEMFGVARRLNRVVPMNSDVLSVSRQIGSFTMTHIGQNQQMTDQDVNTDLVQLTAREVYGLGRLPRSLLEDAAVNVADLYTRAMAEGQAIREDSDWTLGDGTGTYGGHKGLVSALPSAAYTNAAGNAWSAITEDNINSLPGVVENVNISRCAFMCSRQFYMQVMMPKTGSSGRGTMNEFLTVNGLGGAADAQWRGWPVYFNQVMPTASASASCVLYFGEFDRGSMFGDRKSLEIATSEQRYFEYNQIAIRAISRFAINVHGDGRGSTYGPIVCLRTT